jgi:hypothetical protein
MNNLSFTVLLSDVLSLQLRQPVQVHFPARDEPKSQLTNVTKRK